MCRRLEFHSTQAMPRGWRENHKPDSADSQRGWRNFPFRRKSWEKESLPPAASSPENYFEEKTISDMSANATTLLNEKLHIEVPSNTTVNLDPNGSTSTFSPVNLQQETSPILGSLDGIVDNSSLACNGSSNTVSKVLSPSSTKPLGLFPFLAGTPSNVGKVGSVVLPSTTPQWMQFLSDQNVRRKQEDIDSGL